MQGARGIVAVGGVIEQICATATAERAPLIVLGSRQLHVVERFFSTSVGSEVAAISRRPIAVVRPCLD